MLTRHVKHYLEFINGGINTYCWMDESTSKVISGRGTLHGKFKHVQRWYKELIAQEVQLPTLHMCLNETDLSGRKRGNVKAYRVLCCDLDRPILDSELVSLHAQYKPQLVVRSSAEKYHLYWRLERGSDLEVWRNLQLGIASRLNGDLQLSLPTSMIRVPGFPRIGKDGKQVMPSVMTFKDDIPFKELSIKELVKLWPWIWEEAEQGEKELKRQRQEAARIARELMKARGTEYDAAKFARQTPNCGRNTTLYFSLYEVVYTHEDKLTLEEALSYGVELNESFPEPLGAAETECTVSSAWEHALRAREKKVREKLKLLKTLEDRVQTERQEQKTKTKESVGKLIVEALVGKAAVPDSYLDISDVLVERIWTGCAGKQQIAHHNVLVSAFKTRYYKKLTDFLIEQLKFCGAFKVSGYSVYVRGVNDSGQAVRYRKNLDSEALASLLQDILSRLYLYTVKVSMNGKGTAVKGAAEKSLLDHLEGQDYDDGKTTQKETKTNKDKAKKSSKVHRRKADGRSDVKEESA